MDFTVKDATVCGHGDLLNAPHIELASACKVMGQMLERSKGGAFDLNLAINPTITVFIKWIPCPIGKGAGILTWSEGAEIVAESIARSGIDPIADEHTRVEFCAQFNDPDFVTEFLKLHTPPTFSTIYVAPRGITDLKVCPMSVGFAQAFYARLDRNDPLNR